MPVCTCLQANLKCPEGITVSGDMVIPPGNLYVNMRIKDEPPVDDAPVRHNRKQRLRDATAPPFAGRLRSGCWCAHCKRTAMSLAERLAVHSIASISRIRARHVIHHALADPENEYFFVDKHVSSLRFP